MPEFISEGPFAWLFVFLLVVVFLRAQGTYWLGRYMAYLRSRARKPESGWRRSLYDWSQSEMVRSAVAKLRVRGWVIIPLSFLTVGFQTLVNAGAGIIRMSPMLYTISMIPGCLAWSTIYSTIGFSVWNAALAAMAGSPIGITIIATIIVLTTFYIIYRRKKARS